MNLKIQEAEGTASLPEKKQTFSIKYALDACIVLLMCGLLYYGASWQYFKIYTDAAKYQCYAVAFWQGLPALQTFPVHQCDHILHPDPTIRITNNAVLAEKMQRYGFPEPLARFVAEQSPSAPLHALPREYPMLNLVPFSLALLAPFKWFQVAFALEMAVLAAGIYVALLRFRSRAAAIACATYLVTGCWGTALGRFDLIPAALTLFALLLAVRKRWNWAFTMLALGTLFKFYPAILIPPFLLAQQLEMHGERWYSWRRWQPSVIFVALCTVVMGISALLSVGGTIDPLRYFGNRPVQVESFAASLMWLTSLVTQHPLTYAKTFGSLNIFDAPGNGTGLYTSAVSLLGNVLLVLGLLYTFWLQWRRKIDLGTASLLTLLVVIFTGKVFSPQYLIWIAPFVAYVGEANLKWLLSWNTLGLLTTWIYPYIYNMSKELAKVPYLPLFFPVTTVRNFLLLGFILALIFYCSRRKRLTEEATQT
jgi:hypothetical protein